MALKIIFRPWAEGARNVPQRGAAIIASNHLSFADHFFGPLPLRRKVIYLAKSEYFTGRGLKGFISRAFFSALGQVPIDRGGGAASERAMRTACACWPRGSCSASTPRAPAARTGGCTGARPGWPGSPWRPGSGDPVRDDQHVRVHASGKTRPNFRVRPGVRYGQPLDFSRYYGMATDRIVLREVTDEIMQVIEKLSDQESVEMYAQAAKRKLAAGEPIENDPAKDDPSKDETPTDGEL